MGTTIKNVHVFDGRKDCGIQDISFDNGAIVETSKEDFEVIDGTNKTLLPGLFDSHVHLYENTEFLKKSTSYGVTTVCEMGNRSIDITNMNKLLANWCNVLSCYSIAVGPDSDACKRMNYEDSIIMKDKEKARMFVREMVELDADYIKIIIEEPENIFPVELGKTIVEESYKYGKKVIAHATNIPSFKKAIEIGIDVITHMSMEQEIPDEIINEVARKKIVLIPTIVMMGNIADVVHKKNINAPVSIDNAIKNLSKFVKAGVKIIAGTDANEMDPYPPASVPYGMGLLDELQNQKAAGMDNLSILISATSAPSDYFGQLDRGVIENGRRADLLLINGNPMENLMDIYNIENVWLNGNNIKELKLK